MLLKVKLLLKKAIHYVHFKITVVIRSKIGFEDCHKLDLEE